MFKPQLEILSRAIKAVPSVKYALGIIGVAVAGSIIYSLFRSPQEALVAIAIVLILMVLLLLFAKAAAAKNEQIRPAAMAFVWGILALCLLGGTLIFTAIFFDWPKPLNAVFSSSNGFEEELPQLIKKCVKGYPKKACYAEDKGSAVQLFEHGNLIAKFDENIFIAVIKEDDGSIKWHKIIEGFQKGVPTSCDGIEGDSLMRLGFRWWYCSEKFNEIRPRLGKPLGPGIKAWVQYQQWSEGILFFGVPDTKFDYEGDHFQRLLGGFLINYETATSGSGSYFLVSDGNSTNAYCSAIWYPARADGKMTDMQKRQDCKTLIGPDTYWKGNRICDFGN